MAETVIRSPIKAMVWKIEAEVGQMVDEYDPLVILESMKTEIPVAAVKAGVVRKILVEEGATVEEEQALLEIEEVA